MQIYRLIVAVTVIAAPLLLSGCYTTRGVGQDVGAAGNAISKTATDVQKKL